MSMSTRVHGFKPANEKWERMAAVWRACEAAGVERPEEVERFFDGEAPDPNGVEISQQELERVDAVRDWKDEYAQGYEVDVSKLPKDVTVLRFYNSW